MNGTEPETALDITFDDDDLDWDDWLKDDFDSSDVISERTPIAPVGEILKQVRQKMGPKSISQEGMARMLGIPKRTYIAYETQEVVKVPAEVLRRLVTVTDIDAEFILTGRTRYIDHGSLLDEAFQLAKHLADNIYDGDERLSYKDIQEVVFRVFSEREEKRQLTGDQAAEYTKGDIANAVWEHTEYSLRQRRALAEDSANS